ncbi:MAG: hypothetical protein JW891_10110 [Candidatus Lokiarchaeota archaeon]|nr:hypothetical protein [Candidatus Lokiarchaeota archaeon]
MNKDEDKGRPRLHTTISMEKEVILDKLVKLLDKNGNEIYGNKSKVIEKALELLDNYHNPVNEKSQNIWNRGRNELKMVLISKKSFLGLLLGGFKQGFKENNALEIIEWYKQKRVDDMDVIELLRAIKDMWIASNLFYRIVIHKRTGGKYIMDFHHEFYSKEFGRFWGEYFKEFLSLHKFCKSEYIVRNSSLRLEINPTYKSEVYKLKPFKLNNFDGN